MLDAWCAVFSGSASTQGRQASSDLDRDSRAQRGSRHRKMPDGSRRGALGLMTRQERARAQHGARGILASLSGGLLLTSHRELAGPLRESNVLIAAVGHRLGSFRHTGAHMRTFSLGFRAFMIMAVAILAC